jgi:hypothetical protein
MRKRNLYFIVLIALLLTPVEKAFTLPPRESLSSFQCSGGTTSPGDTTSNVIAKCGGPTSVEKSPDGTREVWTYDIDPTKSIYYYFKFRNGTLQRIESSEYGGGE